VDAEPVIPTAVMELTTSPPVGASVANGTVDS
jgi:hypothetical protein